MPHKPNCSYFEGAGECNCVPRKPDGFILEKKSMLSGKKSEMFIPMNEAEFWKKHARWKVVELIQRVFPEFDADLREFLMTGATPAEWETLKPRDE